MLDRLTVRDGSIVDTSGRSVILRGFVTLTADHRGPVELTERNFDQIADWGMNVQQVRLEGCRMGVMECDHDPAYLDKLERWVTWAADRGIYTIFKMTTYDVPSWGVGKAFDREAWQGFWDSGEQQADRIEAWGRAWEHFKGHPAVVGYDVLNEPSFGTEGPEATTERLYSFYEDAGRALRRIDSEALLMVQPIAGMGMLAQASGVELRTPHGEQRSLSDPLSVFAPHFYPDIVQERTEEEYEREMEGFVEEAEQVGAPLLIGEYGLPTRPFPIGRRKLRPWNERDERIKGALFDRSGIGNVRPWYIDDGFWNLCEADYKETERIDAVVRPFPERVAGEAAGWSFRYDTKRFACTVDVDPSVGAPTVLSVQEDRFYSAGAVIEVDGEPADHEIANDRLVIPAGSLSAGQHEIVVRSKGA